MATYKISATSSDTQNSDTRNGNSLWSGYLTFVDSQKEYALPYWIGSLMLLSIILPITFLIVYSLNGPVIPFLAISMAAFFTNVIANMGGASFRFTFTSAIAAIAIHVLIIISALVMVF